MHFSHVLYYMKTCSYSARTICSVNVYTKPLQGLIQTVVIL